MNTRWWSRLSLRTRLVLSVALVHLVMMSVFIVDLTRRQQNLLLDRQQEVAISLTRILATSSESWMLSHDLSGLQEILDSQLDYPELEYAMLLDPHGLVLAHTDPSLIGMEETTLPGIPELTVIARRRSLVDVAAPVTAAGHIVGWVRVGIGQRQALHALDHIAGDGIVYACVAILLGALLAVLLARRLTGGLYAIRQVADAVRGGHREARVIDPGEDEVGQLARDFNAMLEQLTASDEARRTSEERLRLAAEVSNTGLWDWNLLTGEVYYSPEWKTQLGLEVDGPPLALGEWERRLHPEDRQATLAALTASSQDPGLAYHQEYRLAHEDGSWRWIDARGRLLCDAGGHPVRMLGTHSDVTARRAGIAEREQMLRQMQQMQKMEELGQLTGGIAHDFNNILQIILGYNELARNACGAEDNGAALEPLQEVQRAGERARDLIAQMLVFARGGKGNAEVVAPGVILKEVLRMLAATFPSSITLTADAGTAVPPVLLDPVELHQCITNLCINARDAVSGKGHIHIGLALGNNPALRECSACHKEFSGQFVELTVVDDGPGIPGALLSQIFNPFFTTKAPGQGTGMGLPVIMGIVHRRGGHIQVESTPGHTCFRLCFPPAEPESAEKPVVLPGTAHLFSGRDRRILVVDDEKTLARMLTSMLELQGYGAVSYSDPRQALEAFRKDPAAVDAVISDQTMPGLTGLELVRELRILRRDLPVILMSGYSDMVDTERAAALGVGCFLHKPMRIQELLDALRRLLEPADTGAAALSRPQQPGRGENRAT